MLFPIASVDNNQMLFDECYVSVFFDIGVVEPINKGAIEKNRAFERGKAL